MNQIEITRKAEFVVSRNVNSENSFGIVDSQKDVELHVTIEVWDNDRGFFEFYDTQSGGQDWYAEGSLQFDNGELQDYDGVSSLPDFVEDKLREWGIKVD